MNSQNKKNDNLQAILGLSIWEQEKWKMWIPLKFKTWCVF
jgi:hypothetical protein